MQAAIDKAEDRLIDKRKRLKEIDDQVKKYMTGQFRDGDKKVEIGGKKYTWTLTKSVRKSFDTDEALDRLATYGASTDGLYKETETYTLKKKAIEEA